MLLEMYKSMTGTTETPSRIPGQPETAEGGGVPSDVDDFEELLLLAIERERKASTFYRSAAQGAAEYLRGIPVATRPKKLN